MSLDFKSNKSSLEDDDDILFLHNQQKRRRMFESSPRQSPDSAFELDKQNNATEKAFLQDRQRMVQDESSWGSVKNEETVAEFDSAKTTPTTPKTKSFVDDPVVEAKPLFDPSDPLGLKPQTYFEHKLKKLRESGAPEEEIQKLITEREEKLLIEKKMEARRIYEEQNPSGPIPEELYLPDELFAKRQQFRAPPTSRLPPSKLLEEKYKIIQMTHSITDDAGLDEETLTQRDKYRSQLASLQSILEKTVKKEGELLRNRHGRTKDGHRDPMLIENHKLQADIKAKLESVRTLLFDTEKKLNEQRQKLKKAAGASRTPLGSYSDMVKNSVGTTQKCDEDDDDEISPSFDYYDPGSHWCQQCDLFFPKVREFCEHLQTKEHWRHIEPSNRPWKKPIDLDQTQPKVANPLSTPMRGMQFLFPVKGYFCILCKSFMGDQEHAEEHLKTNKHNRSYSKFTAQNKDYDHKWNSDRGKALFRFQQNERKRQREKEHKEREETRKKKLEEERRAKEKEREMERMKIKEEKKSLKTDHHTSSKNSKIHESFRERERERERQREKENRNKEKKPKRKRLSSSSSSSSSSSVDVLRHQKSNSNVKVSTKSNSNHHLSLNELKSSVKDIKVVVKRIDKKTALKYNLKQLLQIFEEKTSQVDKKKDEEKVHSFKMDFTEEAENSEMKNDIDSILNTLDDSIDQTNKDQNVSDVTSDVPKCPKTEEKDKTIEPDNDPKQSNDKLTNDEAVGLAVKTFKVEDQQDETSNLDKENSNSQNAVLDSEMQSLNSTLEKPVICDVLLTAAANDEFGNDLPFPTLQDLQDPVIHNNETHDVPFELNDI